MQSFSFADSLRQSQSLTPQKLANKAEQNRLSEMREPFQLVQDVDYSDTPSKKSGDEHEVISYHQEG